MLVGCLALSLLAISTASAAERHLTVDHALSRVDVAVKVTVDSFVARLVAYDADIRLDSAAPRVTSAVFRFKFADVHTGKDDRDAQMNQWQQTSKFPDATFTLTSLQPSVDSRYTAIGRLQLHGVEREVRFPVSITSDAKVLAIDGEAKIDTREFGLPVIRKFVLLKVDPTVTVRFHLQGAIAAP